VKKLENEEKSRAILGIIGARVEEVRKEKGLSQLELAKKCNIKSLTREKINYIERNLQGRKIQVDELVEIVKALDSDPGYLLGLKKEKTTDTNNTENDSIVGLEEYKAVLYYNKNILTDKLENIENSVNQRKTLGNTDVQRIIFLIYYIDYLKDKRAEQDEYVGFLVRKHEQSILTARAECEKILHYNKHKDVKIDFERIRTIKIILNELENHSQYQLEKQLKTVMADMTNTALEDDKYFYEIKKFTDEQYKK